MSQTVWIARHGNRLDFVHPEWFNTAPRRYDPPLSDDGIIQAQQLGIRLKSEPIAHIFASPFLRAIQTADQVAQIVDLPIKIEAGLSEWLNPEWMDSQPETHPRYFLAREYPCIDWTYQSFFTPIYPETEEQVMQRTGETVRKLVDKFEDNILLIGHKVSVLGATFGLVSGNPTINASLCCLLKVTRHEQNWFLESQG